jgi:hypothetical protein
MIALGIERINDQDLDKLHKGTNVREIHKVIRELFNAGIAPVALFICALEGDTKKELQYLAKHAIDIPAIRYRFAPAYPLKGTEMRIRMKDDEWMDKKFKKDEYASTLIPVLKTSFCKNVKDKSYQYLLNYPHKTMKNIYSSDQYAKNIKKFKKTTGKRFKKFFDYKWKKILNNELGKIDLNGF